MCQGHGASEQKPQDLGSITSPKTTDLCNQVFQTQMPSQPLQLQNERDRISLSQHFSHNSPKNKWKSSQGPTNHFNFQGDDISTRL